MQLVLIHLVINLRYLALLLALSHAKFNGVVSNKHGLKHHIFLDYLFTLVVKNERFWYRLDLGTW